MDENRIPRDSAELLEIREKRRIPRFSRKADSPTDDLVSRDHESRDARCHMLLCNQMY